jgi:hypothetical protein
MACPFFECLYEGTRGPGKSDALIMDYAQHVGQGFGAAWRGILFRRTYKQLDDIATRTLKWFPRIFPGAQFLRSNSDFKWRFPDGAELLLRQMNRAEDYWDYHGHEYPWIGWEELVAWPTLDCYEAMKTCCRSSHPGMPRKYRATANPYGPGHNAVKAYFVDPAAPGKPIQDGDGRQRVRIFGSIYENKILLAADPDYLKNILALTDPNKLRAWLYGDWDITAGGAVDDVWDRAVHVVRSFWIPKTWRVDRSFDWGSSHPFSLGIWAESDGTEAVLEDGTRRSWPKGTLFRIGEWYGAARDPRTKAIMPNKGLGLNSVEIGEGIWRYEQALRQGQPFMRRIEPGSADASIFDKQDDASIFDKIQEGWRRCARASASPGLTGDIFTPSNKAPGTRKTGLELLRTRLAASRKWPMEDKGLFVFDSCTDGFLRTIPTLPRDENDMDVVDTDAEDHCFDEVRYRLLQKRIDIGWSLAGVGA